MKKKKSDKMNKDLIIYQKKYREQVKDKERISNILSRLRLIVFIAFMIILIMNFRYKFFLGKYLLLIIFIVFIIIALYHNYIENTKNMILSYLDIIKDYENRSTGKWKNEVNDIEVVDSQFMLDLDVIGKNSLFQFINFTKSLGGKKALLETLSLKKVTKDGITLNQGAVKELKDKTEFIILFQEKMGKIDKIKEIDFKEYFYFFNKSIKNNIPELLVSLIISLVAIIIFILTTLNLIKPFYLVGIIILQLVSSYAYMLLYKEEFFTISSCSRVYRRLKEIYVYLESIDFKALKNKKLQEDIKKGKVILNNLNKIADLDSYRNNFITYLIFNIFFSLNFIIIYKYSNLLKNDSKSFKNSIKALEEFETLISLTTIPLVKENICLPDISTEMSLNMEEIRHPLLNEKECIENSFICQKDINIITGSNMSGKTSFMRTIGVNLILAYTGTYVNARFFKCPITKIFTSINVKDDISNKPMIIFIDEIFKGTNYNDRILGAKEILKQFTNLNCIVFLTTHDFELCEINNKKIHNYHFTEKYKDNKIHFDYKLKEGECKTTNAQYLMKQMKIIK